MAKRSTSPQRGKISAEEPITIDLLERCLDRLAFEMARAPQGGEVYLPIYESFEADIARMKAEESTMQRAQVRAARYMQERSIKK